VVTGFFPEDKFIRRDFAPDDEEEKASAAKYQGRMQRQLEKQMQIHLREEDKNRTLDNEEMPFDTSLLQM
jgi:hypothetical protein